MGIIHKNMSIEQQAEEVDRVKRSESGVITNPFSLQPHHPVSDAEKLMAKFRISGVPIVDEKINWSVFLLIVIYVSFMTILCRLQK